MTRIIPPTQHRQVGTRGRSRIGIGTFLVLRAVLVFNAVLLVAVAGLLAGFMEHPAGLAGAGLCVLAAGMCMGAARWMDQLYERGR